MNDDTVDNSLYTVNDTAAHLRSITSDAAEAFELDRHMQLQAEGEAAYEDISLAATAPAMAPRSIGGSYTLSFKVAQIVRPTTENEK